MPSTVKGFEYDIFVSYRHNDNQDGWVTDFIQSLEKELRATLKDSLTIYFDENPHDGLLETHDVDNSLKEKLKCLIFIPILSQTYCDPKSFAWRHEFLTFKSLAGEDQLGLKVKLQNGNVASRILPVQIHELDANDKTVLENEIGPLRALEFIFKTPGVNRPLATTDLRNENAGKTVYKDQVNKVANAIKEIVTSLKSPHTQPMREQTASNKTFPQKRNYKKLTISISLLLLIALASYMLYPRLFKTAEEKIDKSIVVLPFVNLTNDPGQEYFSDGLTEEVIDRLTKIRGLRVISRTSSMEYKDSDKRIPEIAHDLGVSFVLEGSVQRSENNLRVIFQLIKGADDEHIWSETIDRPLSEIFSMQRDIATQVASYFKITLTESDKGYLDRIPTQFISAYDYYLRALELSPLRIDENNQASELLKKATNIDPEFAEAWARLAQLNCLKARGLYQGDQWLDTAYRYGSKAILLAPESAYTNYALGLVYRYRDQDSLSIPLLMKSYKLGFPLGLSSLGNWYRETGKFDSAYFYIRQLIVMDPLGHLGYGQMSRIFSNLGIHDSARHYMQLGQSIKYKQKEDADGLNLFAIRFYLHTQEYDQALRIVNDNSDSWGDFKKLIYALQKDWSKLSGILNESDAMLWALVYKNNGNKKEFDKVINSNGIEPRIRRMLLGDFSGEISRHDSMKREVVYADYQFMLTNPFDQEFAQTPEFKRLLIGYEEWQRETLAKIKVIAENKN